METLRPIKIESFNTNNAWGFGGGYGNEYFYSNGVSIRKGTACYRHAPSHSFTDYYITVDGEKYRLYDERLEMRSLVVGRHKKSEKVEMISSEKARVSFDESTYDTLLTLKPAKYLFK